MRDASHRNRSYTKFQRSSDSSPTSFAFIFGSLSLVYFFTTVHTDPSLAGSSNQVSSFIPKTIGNASAHP